VEVGVVAALAGEALDLVHLLKNLGLHVPMVGVVVNNIFA